VGLHQRGPGRLAALGPSCGGAQTPPGCHGLAPPAHTQTMSLVGYGFMSPPCLAAQSDITKQ
jgi:hypothetical protein